MPTWLECGALDLLRQQYFHYGCGNSDQYDDYDHGGLRAVKKDLKGQRFFMFMAVFTMMFSGGIIPTYIVVKGPPSDEFPVVHDPSVSDQYV